MYIKRREREREREREKEINREDRRIFFPCLSIVVQVTRDIR